MSRFWSGRRVLVTGGGGFIGSWAARELVALGACVRATVRPANLAAASLPADVEVIPCDLEIPDLCLEVSRGSDTILSFAHTDGSADYKARHPAMLFRRNISITLNLLEAAAQNGVQRMLIASSAEVYSAAAPVPSAEPEAFRNLESTLGDGYSWSKRMSELAAGLYSREFGIRLLIARPSNVYGPGDTLDPSRGRVIPMFIHHALRGEPIVIWGDGRQLRTFLYVADFVRGALDLAEHGANSQPVNFAGTEEITIRDLAERIVDLAGSPVEIRCDCSKPSGVPRRAVDTTLAETMLRFQPRIDLADGLSKTVSFYRNLDRQYHAQAY